MNFCSGKPTRGQQYNGKQKHGGDSRAMTQRVPGMAPSSSGRVRTSEQGQQGGGTTRGTKAPRGRHLGSSTGHPCTRRFTHPFKNSLAPRLERRPLRGAVFSGCNCPEVEFHFIHVCPTLAILYSLPLSPPFALPSARDLPCPRLRQCKPTSRPNRRHMYHARLVPPYLTCPQSSKEEEQRKGTVPGTNRDIGQTSPSALPSRCWRAHESGAQ
jgi:hypothetical protein